MARPRKDDLLLLEIVEYCVKQQDILDDDLRASQKILADIVRICSVRNSPGPPKP